MTDAPWQIFHIQPRGAKLRNILNNKIVLLCYLVCALSSTSCHLGDMQSSDYGQCVLCVPPCHMPLSLRARLPIVYGLYFWMECPSTSSPPPAQKGWWWYARQQKEAKLQKAGGWDYFLHFCPTNPLHTANWWLGERRTVICVAIFVDTARFRDNAKNVTIMFPQRNMSLALALHVKWYDPNTQLKSIIIGLS